MVKILSTGEIVSDNDPRAQNNQSSTSRPEASVQRRANINALPNNRENENENQGNSVSLFDSLNGRLLAFGIPRWNLGSFVVEPIYSVGLVLMLLMFGLPGILLAALLFVVSQLSRPNAGGLGQLYNSVFGRQNTNENQRQRTQPANNSRPDIRPTTTNDSSRKSKFGGQGNRLGD